MRAVRGRGPGAPGVSMGVGERSPPAWWVALAVVLLAPWLDHDPRWPAWFGGLVVALGAALGLAALRPGALAVRLGRPTRVLAVCVAALVGLAALQTLPLGPLLDWLSPATVEARGPFLPEGLGPTCLSLEPHLTRSGGLAWAGAAVVALVAARTGRPRALLAALLAGGALQALLALPEAARLVRARGTFVSSNNLALLLAMLLPLSLALGGVGQLVRPRGWRSALPLLAGGLVALGLVATRSRSGAIAGVVGLVVHVVLLGPTRGRRFVWVVGLAAALAFAAGGDLLLGRFGRLFAGEDTDRLAFWAIAWQLFTRFPLLGAGLRTHAAVTPELHAGPRLLDAAHNDYLNLLADCGLVGGALATAAAVAWLLAVRRGLAEVPAGGSRRGLLAACAGATAGAAAASVVDFGLQVPAVLWTFAALAGVAAGGDPDARRARAPSGWSRALGVGLGVAALALAFQGGRLLLARLAVGRAQETTLETGADRRVADLALAARLWPEQGWLDLARGRVLREAGEPQAAYQALLRAARKSPRDPWVHLALAAGESDPRAVRAALDRARRLAPRDPAVRLESARLALAGDLTPADRAAGLGDLREALTVQSQDLDLALAVLLPLPRLTVSEVEGVLGGAAPAIRRRCAAALAPGAPGPARRLLEPLLGTGATRADLARAAELDLRLGRPDAARAEWLAAARASDGRPGDDPAPLLAMAARALERAGRADLAEALLVEAAAPGAPATVWRELGRLRLRGRRYAEARAALEQAVALDARVGGPELGDVHAAEGRADSALLAWQRAAQAASSTPERVALQLRVARLLAARGDAGAAAEAARAALALDPANAQARALLAGLEARR